MRSPSAPLFEPRRREPAEVDRLLVQALRGRAGRLTKADAVAATGLSAADVEEGLGRLLKRYRSRLAVTEDGELLYAFDPGFVRRDEPTLAERLRAVGRILARAFVWLFKAWIALTLVFYVILFVALLIGVSMGLGGQTGRDDRSERRGSPFGGGFFWLFWPDFGYGWGAADHDAWGRARARPQPEKRKGLLATVYDFVFGPARPAPDPLTDEREVLAFLRARGGRLVATDLVALFGVGYARADEEVTRLLCAYEGDVSVTDEGALVYAFPGVLRTAAPAEARGPARGYRFAWERKEEQPKLTGNRTGADVLIAAFAAFNLAVSTVGADLVARNYGLVGPQYRILFTVFPLVFFAIFLGLPLARAAARWVGDRARSRRRARAEALRLIFAAEGSAVREADLVRVAGEEEVRKMVVDLEGDVAEPGADGAIRYVFPRIAEEREARVRVVAQADVAAERSPGPVIFGDEKDEDEHAAEEEAALAARPAERRSHR